MRSIIALLLITACATRPASNDAGGVRAGFDTSVRACDDFYQHAVGPWLKQNPIPPAFDSWGRFNVLAEDNRAKLRAILEEAATTSAPRGTRGQRLGDFWRTCIDEAAIERQGAQPLADQLARLRGIRTKDDVIDAAAHLHALGMPSLFGFGADSDLRNPSMNIANAGQGNLGLPEPNYYSDTDDRAKQIREAYYTYVTRLLALTGDDTATAARNAREIVRLETELASAQLTRVQRRDIEAQYNMRSLAELQSATPSFDWTRWLAASGAPRFERLNVVHPKYFEELERQLVKRTPAEWSNYLRFRLADAAAPYLSSAFSDAHFDFRGRMLQGRKEQLRARDVERSGQISSSPTTSARSTPRATSRRRRVRTRWR